MVVVIFDFEDKIKDQRSDLYFDSLLSIRLSVCVCAITGTNNVSLLSSRFPFSFPCRENLIRSIELCAIKYENNVYHSTRTIQ